MDEFQINLELFSFEQMTFSPDDEFNRQRASRISIIRQADFPQVFRPVLGTSRDHAFSLRVFQHQKHGEPSLLSRSNARSHLHQRH